MTTERDVGAGLRSMFREQAATPTAGLSRALAEIQVTSQDRARRLPRLPEWRIDIMLSATRFVIGALIVATVGAGLFAAIQPRSSEFAPGHRSCEPDTVAGA